MRTDELLSIQDNVIFQSKLDALALYTEYGALNE